MFCRTWLSSGNIVMYTYRNKKLRLLTDLLFSVYVYGSGVGIFNAQEWILSRRGHTGVGLWMEKRANEYTLKSLGV